MKRTIIALIAAASASIASAAPALAVDEQNTSRGASLKGPGVAAHSYDVVEVYNGRKTPGVEDFAAVHDGAFYRFASQDNLEAFKASPGKYAPQYGGYCAFGVALGKKLDGDPRYSKVVDGKLYFNVNDDILQEWLKDTAAQIEKADANWPRVKSKSPGQL